MSDNTYNGWTNYATWRINLEICDDLTSSMVGEDDKFDNVDDLASYLEERVDEVLTNFGQIEEGLALDYARAFVSEVNWYEIAQANADGLVSAESDEEDES